MPFAESWAATTCSPDPGDGAAKALQLSAEQVEGSSIVTTIARNGTTFGIRLAGSPRWHVPGAPPVGEALSSPFRGRNQRPDIGTALC